MMMKSSCWGRAERDNLGGNSLPFWDFMKRHVLIYGLIGGLVFSLLKSTEYRFLASDSRWPTLSDFCQGWARLAVLAHKI